MTMHGFSDRDLGVIRKRDALTGIRGWYQNSNGDGLKGMYGKTWEPGPHRAACDRHMHGHRDYEIPFLSCWCGFWAGYSMDPIREFHYGDKAVVGVVRGWGRMVGGERGFRAERAEITGLHLAYEYVRPVQASTPTGKAAGWTQVFSQATTVPESAAKLAEDERELAERYPGIPFYPSIDALLEAHPTRRKK